MRHNSTSGEGVLSLVIEQPSDEPIEKIKAELDSRLDDIAFFIKNQGRDLAGYDSQLRQEIASAIVARRSRLKHHDGLAALLGIPESPAQKDTPQFVQSQSRSPAATARSARPEDETWDAFVSHASEDKDSFVRPLVAALTGAGLRVWYDEATLRIGDSLRRSIDRGLARSRFGIVIVSKSFLAKHWPQLELDGLAAREVDGSKVILPIWHEITATELRSESPMLADRLAVTSDRGIPAVVSELLKVIRPEQQRR